MTDTDLLVMLKTDLGISTATAYDKRLAEYLASARSDISREGIVLEDNIEDNQIVVQYAAWMWRARKTGEAMPRMLRYKLNNRLFSQKMRGDQNG